MKLKKFIALLAATTLAMSTMAVSAAEGQIEGGMNYVNTTIYKVQLPTTAEMTFTLDPQGLTSLDDTDNGTTTDTEAGKIISTGKMKAVNMSSVDVDLYADFYIEDSDSATSLTLGTSINTNSSNGNKEDAKELALTITPTLANGAAATGTVKIGGSAVDGTAINVTSSTAASSITTGTNKFEMGAAKYEFGGNATTGYTYDMVADSETGVEMAIGGKIAKDYDWSAYTGDSAETLTLNAVFKFYEAGSTTDEVTATPTAPTTPTYSKASGATLTTTAGKNAVTSVKYGPASGNTPNTLTGYTYTKPTLTLPSGLFSSVTAGTSRYIQITYGDGSTEVLEVIVQN